jgi:Ecdysteroid kinase-like family
LQRKLVNEMGIFDQEIGFFEHCLPILLKQCPDLPVVRCFYSNDLDEKIIYMEDLKEKEYFALLHSMTDLKNDVLSLDHYRVMMQALGKFHSASVGINWAKKFPRLFPLKSLDEGSGKSSFKNIMVQSIVTTIIPIAEFAHGGDDELLTNIRWLASADFIKAVKTQSSPDSSAKNVLCHGDCWVNNMMFKTDPQTKMPLDVILIDFQLCRYAPQCRDLMNCLNMCASVNFRKKYEQEILKFYFDAYNKSCAVLGKDDCMISWDELCRNYDGMRIYGLLATVAFRPMIYLKGNFPEDDGGITEDQFKQFMNGGNGMEESIKMYQENTNFRAEMNNIIEEANTMLKKWHSRADIAPGH